MQPPTMFTPEIQENNRCAIFNDHIALIEIAEKADFETLKENINKLSPLKNSLLQKLPQTPNNSNIFKSILSNATLTPQNKSHLLNIILYTKGYEAHHHYLLKSPALEVILADALLHRIASPMYEAYLEREQNDIPIDKERAIWRLLLSNQIDNAENLFLLLLKYKHATPKLVKFTLDWINAINDPNSIIRIFDRITDLVKDNPLQKYLDFFNRTAKLRIIFLELGLHEAPLIERNERQDTQIEDFLNQPRTFLYKLVNCFFDTRSKRIYDKIHHFQFKEAHESFKEQKHELEQQVNKKLSPF